MWWHTRVNMYYNVWVMWIRLGWHMIAYVYLQKLTNTFIRVIEILIIWVNNGQLCFRKTTGSSWEEAVSLWNFISADRKCVMNDAWVNMYHIVWITWRVKWLQLCWQNITCIYLWKLTNTFIIMYWNNANLNYQQRTVAWEEVFL